MSETKDMREELVDNADDLAKYALEIRGMRKLLKDIQEAGPENPTAEITIKSRSLNSATVTWSLCSDTDADGELNGLTGIVVRGLKEQIKDEEANLSLLLEQYKKRLDDTLLSVE